MESSIKSKDFSVSIIKVLALLTASIPVSIVFFARFISCWISLIIVAISFVEFALCSDKLRISSATTAKPLPYSPALAASIAALRANKLVCSATLLIVFTILPIESDLLFKLLTIVDNLFVTSLFILNFSLN